MPETKRPRRIAPVNHDPEAIRWAREAKGWRQAEFARQLGISKSLLCEIEAAQPTRAAGPALLRQMAEILNCPVSVLERKQPDGPDDAPESIDHEAERPFFGRMFRRGRSAA